METSDAVCSLLVRIYPLLCAVLNEQGGPIAPFEAVVAEIEARVPAAYLDTAPAYPPAES